MPNAPTDPTSDTPPKKRRFRLRYSLRSLLIFMLLCSAALALWRDWTPWQVEHVLRSHEGDIYAAAFSPDGRRIVTASKDGTARVWDVETGRELHALKGRHDSIKTAARNTNDPMVTISPFAFSPDGSRFVMAPGGTARVINSETRRELYVMEGHGGWVLCVAFSPDGRRIVIASADDTVRVWRRVRPEWRWGVFWLPQFWFTVLFAVGFVWSLRRDYKRLMRVQPS